MWRGSVCGFCFDYIGIYRTCVEPQMKRTPSASHVHSSSVCSESLVAVLPDRSSSCEYFTSWWDRERERGRKRGVASSESEKDVGLEQRWITERTSVLGAFTAAQLWGGGEMFAERAAVWTGCQRVRGEGVSGWEEGAARKSGTGGQWWGGDLKGVFAGTKRTKRGAKGQSLEAVQGSSWNPEGKPGVLHLLCSACYTLFLSFDLWVLCSSDTQSFASRLIQSYILQIN